MSRAFNFSAGPAVLPDSVLRQAQAEMLEWRDSGASIVEHSHRGAEFIEVATQAEADLRTLMAIPSDYAVLFLGGGATTQQALIPLNIAAPGQAVDYVLSGHWGKTAVKQAKPYVDVRIAATSEAGGFRDLQTLYWIAKYAFRIKDVRELVRVGVFTARELGLFRRRLHPCHVRSFPALPFSRPPLKIPIGQGVNLVSPEATYSFAGRRTQRRFTPADATFAILTPSWPVKVNFPPRSAGRQTKPNRSV